MKIIYLTGADCQMHWLPKIIVLKIVNLKLIFLICNRFLKSEILQNSVLYNRKFNILVWSNPPEDGCFRK